MRCYGNKDGFAFLMAGTSPSPSIVPDEINRYGELGPTTTPFRLPSPPCSYSIAKRDAVCQENNANCHKPLMLLQMLRHKTLDRALFPQIFPTVSDAVYADLVASDPRGFGITPFANAQDLQYRRRGGWRANTRVRPHKGIWNSGLFVPRTCSSPGGLDICPITARVDYCGLPLLRNAVCCVA